MNVAVDYKLLASGSVNSFLTGKRCKRLHALVSLGLEIMNFQLFLDKEGIASYVRYFSILIRVDCQLQLYWRTKICRSIWRLILYLENASFGKTAHFYMTYTHLINYYHMLSRSFRTGDVALFKYTRNLPKIANLFFVFNQRNYARWLAKYHDNLITIDETHPEIVESMKKGYFGIQRTKKSFSRQPIDLTLEQTINAEAGKRLVGVTNFTNSISARQRHKIRSSMISFTYCHSMWYECR